MSIAVQRACGALRFDAMRRAVMSYGRVAQKKILIVALFSFFMSQEFVAVCEATLCVSSVAAGSTFRLRVNGSVDCPSRCKRSSGWFASKRNNCGHAFQCGVSCLFKQLTTSNKCTYELASRQRVSDLTREKKTKQ